MLNNIKYKLRSMKKAVTATKTIIDYRSKIFHSRQLVAVVEAGIHVYHSDDYVGAICGDLTDAAAFAIPSKKEIYINTPMTKIPRGYANAIIAHEIGHILLEHDPGATYAADNAACKGHGFEIELEADKFAQDRGYDMIGALHHLYRHGYHGKTVEMRLKALTKARFGN